MEYMKISSLYCVDMIENNVNKCQYAIYFSKVFLVYLLIYVTLT